MIQLSTKRIKSRFVNFEYFRQPYPFKYPSIRHVMSHIHVEDQAVRFVIRKKSYKKNLRIALTDLLIKWERCIDTIKNFISEVTDNEIL